MGMMSTLFEILIDIVIHIIYILYINIMQDWEYSFTTKQSKKTSNNFHISEEVRKIISYNMTPFKENINNIPLTPVTHRLDSKLEEAIK